MQSFHKNNFSNSTDPQPVDLYMGRQILLSRVFSHGSDKGLWLHWCHPKDEGQKGVLKCGYFISPGQTLEDALHAVHQLIEASIELEMSGDARFNFHPESYPPNPYLPSPYQGGHLAEYGSELRAVPA